MSAMAFSALAANFSMAAFVGAMLASRVSGKFLDGGICGSNAGVDSFLLVTVNLRLV